MADPRPDAPLSIRQAAELAGMRPRTLKRRLRAHEATHAQAVTFRHASQGKLYTTLAMCRLAFGEEFARAPTEAERLDTVEDKVRGLRRDLNALATRQRKFFELASKWFQRVKVAQEKGREG